MDGADIRFPNLGITIPNLEKGISVFGFTITFYGIIIAFGMFLGLMIAQWQARRTKQDDEIYLEFAIYAVLFSVIGARIYYVIFEWNQYKSNLLSIFNTREGGLAIYGGIIGGVLTAIIYSKLKKINVWLLIDTACAGLVTGQILGRWGNFCNKEAFGGYTNNLLAMQLKKSEVAKSNITTDLANHITNLSGVDYIQVHPTFLYESVWNIGVLIVILFMTKRKKFDGQLFLLYIIGYALGRVWIEGLRTDQLLVWGTNIAVSQMLSAVLIVTAGIFYFYQMRKYKKTI